MTECLTSSGSVSWLNPVLDAPRYKSICAQRHASVCIVLRGVVFDPQTLQLMIVILHQSSPNVIPSG